MSLPLIAVMITEVTSTLSQAPANSIWPDPQNPVESSAVSAPADTVCCGLAEFVAYQVRPPPPRPPPPPPQLPPSPCQCQLWPPRRQSQRWSRQRSQRCQRSHRSHLGHQQSFRLPKLLLVWTTCWNKGAGAAEAAGAAESAMEAVSGRTIPIAKDFNFIDSLQSSGRRRSARLFPR